jgi:hypothetical protein
LILDNLRVHHSQVVKQWLKANADKIEVFYLPSYSPELNPDELLKCRPEAKGHHNCPGKNENGPDKDRILFAPQYPEAAATGAALLPPSGCQVRRMSMTISGRSNSDLWSSGRPPKTTPSTEFSCSGRSCPLSRKSGADNRPAHCQRRNFTNS